MSAASKTCLIAIGTGCALGDTAAEKLWLVRAGLLAYCASCAERLLKRPIHLDPSWGLAMRLGGAFTFSCIMLAAAVAPGMAAAAPCANPNALGLSRTVEVDTTGGPGFGFEQYNAHDFLLLKEVVLTFDDGPWPNNTRAVLQALEHHCVKAIFFPIGKHALWHPEILKEVAAAGHTIGGHTWSHANLAG